MKETDRNMMARLLPLVLVTGMVLALGTLAPHAEDWPNHPVKMIVPYGPGGVTDVIARLVADRFSKAFGQPFVLENRGGAGGALGTELAARSPKDGYTIYLSGGAPLTIVPQMQKVSYAPVRDLTPVGMITNNAMAFTVHPDLPVHSLREFFDYVRAHPGRINYSVGGIGSSSQLAPALLAAREGLDMLAVPYQSMPPAISALLAGTVQMFFGNISDAIEPIRSGKFRLLAISSDKAQPCIPRRPDRRRDSPRLHHDRLAWGFRAGRHAAADRRAAVWHACGDQPGRRIRQDSRQCRHRHGDRHAG